MGWAGTRSATKPSFDTIGCGASDVARKTTVYGPGRFFAQNASAIAVRCPKRKTSPTSATEIETGRSRGRDFAAYSLSTAPAWNGSAASPYTVSGGWTTTPPAPRMSRIRPNAAGSKRYFVPRDRATTVSTTALQNDGSPKGFLALHVQEVGERVRRVCGRRVRIQPQACGSGELRDDRSRERCG